MQARKVNSNYARPSVISQQTQLHWLRDFGCVFKEKGADLGSDLGLNDLDLGLDPVQVNANSK